MNIEIIDRQSVRVACLRHTGPLGEPVGKFWRATVGPWLADHGLVDCPRYGVSIDDPKTTPAERCRYDACVELPPGLTLPDAETRGIAGGRYAVTTFKGTSADIGAAWGAFLGECAARSLRMDESRQPFEHYPRGSVFDARHGVFACELCLPVG
jgi:AraC family transcriptional regulator